MASYCSSCTGIVTKRMHALQCTDCELWRHRKCDTGITPQQYKEMKAGDLALQWRCRPCETVMEVDLPNSSALPDAVPPQLDVTASPIRTLDATYIGRRDDDDISDADILEAPSLVEEVPSRMEDRSFDVTGREFHQPTAPLDDSIPDRPLDDVILEDVPVTFQVVEGGSKRGGQKLISSDGYTYTKRNTVEGRVYWTCSVRNKSIKCPASVKQFGDVFTVSIHSHQHAADPGALKKTVIAAKVKQDACDNVFRPARDIVESAIKNETSRDDYALPKPALLARIANRYRQKFRPKDPTTLDFGIDECFIGEDFVMDDVRVDDQRHIILATADQLQQLRQSRRWFMDGTFKVVRRPFYQLMSIHAFVRKGDDVKQVPLAYVLMSRRAKTDYVAVLNSLREKLGQPLVEWIMLDFEAAAWQALREVFPGVLLKGCVFHWTQRVYRKIQLEGLATAYLEKEDKHRFFRKLMGLPYLPAEQIVTAFEQLDQQAREVGGPVLAVTSYVRRTWIEGRVWQPANWSVFRETVRTNNDVEGWHRRITSELADRTLASTSSCHCCPARLRP